MSNKIPIIQEHELNTINKRIGIVPNSNDYSHPQDRRRYVPFLNKFCIPYETADYHIDYDILYISLSADLNQWANYKNKQRNKNKDVRVIVDLSDIYLVDTGFKDSLRSIFHFLSGRTNSLKFSYKETIMLMLQSTDVLICGSEEQKAMLDEIHNNVIVVRDYFFDDIKCVKNDYTLINPQELNIVWEGFSHGNKKGFQMIKNVISGIENYKIKLHIVTDPKYCNVGTKYFCKPTYSVLKKLFSNTNIEVHLYSWNSITFSSIVKSCDLAIIPIVNDVFSMSKPENKLLLFWSLGIPVIATATKSYKRVMHKINEDFICFKNFEWKGKILELAESKSVREKYMGSALEYLKTNCTEDIIFHSYHEIFFN